MTFNSHFNLIWQAYLVYTLPSPYQEEIIGLSKATDIPLGMAGS